MLFIVVVVVRAAVCGVGRSVICGGSGVIGQFFFLSGWVIFVGVMVGSQGVNSIFVGIVAWGITLDNRRGVKRGAG